MAQDAVSASARRRILLVDDNVDFTTSLAMLLEQLGHEVRIAHDGHEALIASAGFAPEFAFLDLGLPEISGFDLARALRAASTSYDTVLVALSGWDQPRARERSARAGFSRHLVKPVALETIREVLETLAPTDNASDRT